MRTKLVKFNAVDPQTKKAIELEGRASEFFLDDEYRIPCFIHKRGPFYYVFERETGLGISMKGERTMLEAVSHAKDVCLEHGGVKGMEEAVTRAIRSRGVINP